MQRYVLLTCTFLVLQVMSSMRASESRCRRNCFEGPVWTSTDGPAAMKELGTVSALIGADSECRSGCLHVCSQVHVYGPRRMDLHL